MSDRHRLTLIRAIHTTIYLVMAAATFVLVYAGITDDQGPWLWIALALLAVESVVYLGNGMRCPIPVLAACFYFSAIVIRLSHLTRYHINLMAIGFLQFSLYYAL